MSDTNTALWDSVKVTDPRAVKPITGKSYKGDSPKPYWLIRRATEVFGPIGIGWGITVKSERFERMTDTDVLHVAVVSVWYMLDGKRSETFDQMGGTTACYKSNAGKMIVDEDAGKKSVTDGMVKCLSMIGFAGDIFAGQWNDSKYVQWAAEQFQEPAADAEPSFDEGAKLITAGVAKGDAAGAAQYLATCSDERYTEIWRRLDAITQDKITEAWPK